MRVTLRILVVVLSATVMCGTNARGLTGDERALHVLNRLGYGPKPGDIEQVLNMGVDRYIETQLNPNAIPLPAELEQRIGALSAVEMSAGESVAEFLAARKAAKQDDEQSKQERRELNQRLAEQAAEARLARAIGSPRQLEEVMVDFWFNHFNVFEGKGLDRALVASYERDAIRPYALGHFRDLLGATAKHPAMLFYLDNWLSVAPGFQQEQRRASAPGVRSNGLNENYARELMELHTLGVDGGYSQKDVTELARVLTGWTFAPGDMARRGGGFRFDSRRHDWGDKQWLGHHVTPQGQSEGEWALDVLAAHPATAKHISYQLAQYFVADQPPPALVDRLAHRFQDTRGDIRAVLATLFSSSEFWDPANVGTKFKTPYQFVVSSARAANVNIANVRPVMGTLAQLGMPLYGCQTPDGYKTTEDAWLNPDALTRRINFATALASGRLPLAKPRDRDAGLSRVERQPAVLPISGDNQRGDTVIIDADQLLKTLGASITSHTRDIVLKSQPSLRAALVLGSPDFMRH